jgi:hypothetical protein
MLAIGEADAQVLGALGALAASACFERRPKAWR